MKYLISIILTVGMLYGGTAFSNTGNNKSVQQDSTANKEFIDENQNGIDDREENGQGKCYKGRRGDRFVDKDGDGICDEREGSIGPKRRHRGGRNGNNK
jgi:hypothetical protein